MSLFNYILGTAAAIMSISSSYGAYNNYLINKEKYIKEIVSDSVEYSYCTYVKEQKKICWTDVHKKIARNYAVNYFNDNSIYTVDKIRLNRMIEFRLLEIKSLMPSK